jgi:hypothetical protein
MKRTFVVAVVVTGLALAATASGANRETLLTGSFRTTLSGKSPQLNGTWVLRIDRQTHFTLAKNGAIVVRGTAAGTNGRLAIVDKSGPYACKGLKRAAVYKYTLAGSRLTLKPQAELCDGRKAILTAHALTKIA